MNDKELLMMAAKAADVSGEWVTGYEGDYYYQGNTDGIMYQLPQGGWIVWNPLTDDGDALRLAVKLKLDVDCNWCSIGSKGDCMVFSPDDQNFMEAHNGDPYAATRRAIVRAAAEIGRKL